MQRPRPCARVWLGLHASLYTDCLGGGLARHSIRIAHPEPAFIFGTGFEIQDAPGKPVWHGVIQVLAPPVDVLAANAHEGQRLPPRGAAPCHGAILHLDRRIPVGIALDRPFKPQVVQGRMLYHQLPGPSVIGLAPYRGGGPHHHQEE